MHAQQKNLNKSHTGHRAVSAVSRVRQFQAVSAVSKFFFENFFLIFFEKYFFEKYNIYFLANKKRAIYNL